MNDNELHTLKQQLKIRTAERDYYIRVSKNYKSANAKLVEAARPALFILAEIRNELHHTDRDGVESVIESLREVLDND